MEGNSSSTLPGPPSAGGPTFSFSERGTEQLSKSSPSASIARPHPPPAQKTENKNVTTAINWVTRLPVSVLRASPRLSGFGQTAHLRRAGHRTQPVPGEGPSPALAALYPGEVWVAAVLAAAEGGEVGDRPVTGSGTGAGPPAASPSPFPARSHPGSR